MIKSDLRYLMDIVEYTIEGRIFKHNRQLFLMKIRREQDSTGILFSIKM